MVKRFVFYNRFLGVLLICMAFVSVCAQNNDTILVSQHVPSQLSMTGYDEEEYFLKSGKELSAFSCIVTCKEGEVRSIRILQSKDLKRSFIDVTDIVDTSQYIEPSDCHDYFPISYSQKIKALEEMLIILSKKTSFSQEISFIMMLEDAGEQTLSINSSFRKALTQKKEDPVKVLKHVIEKSQLYYDLSIVFNHAQLQVISVDIEKRYSIPKEVFLKNNILCSVREVPNHIESATLFFKIAMIGRNQ